MRSTDAAILALALCAGLASCTQDQQAVEKPVPEPITATAAAMPTPPVDQPATAPSLPESNAPSDAEARQVVAAAWKDVFGADILEEPQ